MDPRGQAALDAGSGRTDWPGARPHHCAVLPIPAPRGHGDRTLTGTPAVSVQHRRENSTGQGQRGGARRARPPGTPARHCASAQPWTAAREHGQLPTGLGGAPPLSTFLLPQERPQNHVHSRVRDRKAATFTLPAAHPAGPSCLHTGGPFTPYPSSGAATAALGGRAICK